MLDELLDKRQKYLEIQADIKLEDNFDEIEEKVRDFRKSLEKQFQDEKTRKLEKVGAYLECIDELIKDFELKQIEKNEREENLESEYNLQKEGE